MKTNYKRWYAVWALSLSGLCSLGCNDSDEVRVFDGEQQGGPTLPGAGGSAGGGNDGSAGSGTATAGAGGSGNGGSAGGQAVTACVEEPSAPEDFLNRCTDSTCRPFDNELRLGLAPGESLPEVP